MKEPGEKIVHDTDETQALADAERLIRAGVNTKDTLTQAIGVTRLIKQVGTNVPSGFAKAIGLDKVETKED